MGDQHRRRALGQAVTGDAAKQIFAQSGPTIGAEHDEIGAAHACLVKQALWPDGAIAHFGTMTALVQAQVTRPQIAFWIPRRQILILAIPERAASARSIETKRQSSSVSRSGRNSQAFSVRDSRRAADGAKSLLNLIRRKPWQVRVRCQHLVAPRS